MSDKELTQRQRDLAWCKERALGELGPCPRAPDTLDAQRKVLCINSFVSDAYNRSLYDSRTLSAMSVNAIMNCHTYADMAEWVGGFA